MTAPRNITTQWSGGDTEAEVVLPECVSGDLLVIIAGGGNQVLTGPSGWTAYGALTGQEAQGRRFTKTADGSEGGTTVTLTFDGGDQRYIVAIAVRDWEEHGLNFFERVGAVGGTYPAGDIDWTANEYQGDLLITFVFARNAAAAPTLDRGVVWEQQTGGGSSAALFLESAPAYTLDSPTALTLPDRSGHVIYQMAVWDYAWTDWQQDADFEYVQNQLLPEVNDTRFDNGSADGVGGYPTIDQDTFLDSQAAQVFDSTNSVQPARWSHDRTAGIVGGSGWSRSWSTRRRYMLYAAQLTDSQLEPADLATPPEGYETLEFDGESQAVGAYSLAVVDDFAADDTDGGSSGLLAGSFSTVLTRGTGVTWNTPGSSPFVTAWDHSYVGGPFYVRSGQLDPVEDTSLGVVDLTSALDPSARGRLAVASFVAGSMGTGDPAITLRSYDLEGAADFGAAFDFLPSSAEGGGLHWVIRPAPVRFLVRRNPVVDIIPVPIPKLRLYPRDDVLGFGGVARQYPPPRRARNYGQQP